MIGLTRIGRNDYESLLRDGELPIDEIKRKYGAGSIFRLQGILCAVTVHQCAEDAEVVRLDASSAEKLFALVKEYRYDTIFEDNRMENIKPGPTTLGSMLFSMCQAETGDYGSEC